MPGKEVRYLRDGRVLNYPQAALDADAAEVVGNGEVVFTANRVELGGKLVWVASDSRGDPWLSLQPLLAYRGHDDLY